MTFPIGYTFEIQPEVMLRDDDGNVVAHGGDVIYVGGGMDADDANFVACGYVSTDPP